MNSMSPSAPPLSAIASATNGVAPVSTGRRSGCPLSFAQRRLWFIEQLQPGEPVYNLPELWRVTGALDLAAFEKSVNEMVRRHQSFRTVFARTHDEPVQIVLPFRAAPLKVSDLSSAKDPGAEASKLIHNEVRAPFDLAKGPLFRCHVFRLSSREHLVVFNAHHIIWDGWSIEIFRRELAEFYTALAENRPAQLEPLPLTYTEFARQQQELSRGDVWKEQLAYWKQKLEGPLPALELPTARPRSASGSFHGSTAYCFLDSFLVEKLRNISRRHGATLFMTLLAAFKVLLFRYSRQTDIVVGSPIAARNDSETQGVIGFFVNTLVLRTDLSGNPAFAELLNRVRKTTLEAYANQDTPFEKVVQELQPERTLNHNPLFQVLFGYERITAGTDVPTGTAFHFHFADASGCGPGNSAPKPGALSVEILDVDLGTSKFDWTVLMQETEHGIRVAFEYSTELFDAETIDRVLRNFQVLLACIAENPQRAISELPLISSAEMAKLLTGFNQTARFRDKSLCVHQLFEAQAARTPDATAIVDGGRTLCYRELNERANQLAWRLRQMGVGPDTRVGLCIERSLELGIAVLATLKAGGAYVPLDPDYPKERLSRMIEIVRPVVLVTRARFMPGLPLGDAEVLCLELEEKVQRTRSDIGNLDSPVASHHLAYVIFTSGSTGDPKGVAMPHGPLANLICWQLENFAAAPAARTLQFASPSFDVSFQEMFSTWCAGGALVFASDEQRRDPTLLWRLIRTENIQRMFLPYVALQQLAEVAGDDCPEGSALREVITAGEQLRVTPQIAALFNRLPNCVLCNQYGPSETHVVTAYTLKQPAAVWPTLPPIGKPITNAQIYILDEALRPVPVGAPGELCIGGECLARGYFNRADLTSERFVPNPFQDALNPSARLYRTGDLARWLPDGNIEFLGRADCQLKIRGYRIEPGEIETVLLTHPALQEAVVIGRPNERTGLKELVAYVVVRQSGQDVRPDTLRAFLGQTVPEYMVPSHFLFLESIPVTSNGKVDRKRLPASAEVVSEETGFVAPRTPAEDTIARIWGEVLGCERIGVSDHFFHLGGHSLLAAQVASRIGRAFEVELPVRAIFEAPTLAALADKVVAIPRSEKGHTAPISRRLQPNEARDLLARIDELSEAEVEALLRTPELNQL